MTEEPAITVNGIPLSPAQAMTLRVALFNFLMELDDPERMANLGGIGPLYRARAGEIVHAMYPKVTERLEEQG